MKKEEVLKKFFPSPDDTVFGKQFISSIYRAGYIILSPEEEEKVKKKKEGNMKELSKKRLVYLLAIMEKNSIEYSVDNNSYEIRLIPEIQQARKQIKALIKKEVTEEWIEKKAFRLFARLLNINGAFLEAEGMRNAIKAFIRSLVGEINGVV